MNSDSKLGEYVEITSSKRIKRADYVDAGVPFYRSKEVIERAKGNRVSTELFISRDQFDEIQGRFGSPKSGDILLTSVGTLGVSLQVEDETEFYFKDGNLTWFKNFAENLDSRYLLYWIRSEVGQRELDRISIGSTQRALTIVSLKSIPFDPPPLKQQKVIAHILGTLDDKIELNRRMNETLEAIAQALFKSWFIDFDPVQAKAEGRKPFGMDEETTALFPDSFVDSELGMIPEGWELKRMLDKVNLTMGQSPSSKFYNKDGDGLPFHQGVTNYGERFPTHEQFSTEGTRYAEEGDLLFSVRAPVGRINISNSHIIIGRGLVFCLD